MKIINKIIAVIILVYTSLIFFTCCSSEEPTSKTRLIFDDDGTNMLGNQSFNLRPLTLQDIDTCIDMISNNTQVTTFMMNSGSSALYYRSKYDRIIGEPRGEKIPTNYDTALIFWVPKESAYVHFLRYYKNFLRLEKEGTDLIDASLRRAKKKGMETFISIRMNDLHFTDTTLRAHTAFSTFWLAHPEYWLNENTGWHSAGALDFSKKEVRDYKLALITEQLEKYGELIDGYNLDFMRFPVYFRSTEGREYAPLMTQLMKDIKAKVDELSAKRGKKILLSVLVPSTIEQCLEKGFDIQEWTRLGIVDFITIGVFFNGDPSLPVAQFKKDLNIKKFPIYATIDDGGFTPAPREKFSHGMYRGMASHILAQGGEGIYLYNYFLRRYLFYKKQYHLEPGGYMCRVVMPQLLQELGSLETLKNRNKIYCLSDCAIGGYGIKYSTPLPLQVNSDKPSLANIFIGDDVKKIVPQEAILFIRIDKSASYDLTVNGEKITEEKPSYVQLYDRARGLKNPEEVHAFILPKSCLMKRDNVVSFTLKTPNSFSVTRIDLALKYGDVKTNGYF